MYSLAGCKTTCVLLSARLACTWKPSGSKEMKRERDVKKMEKKCNKEMEEMEEEEKGNKKETDKREVRIHTWLPLGGNNG